ncbi:hypothetical protein ORV05_04685 [Amycolatopsis cynarae]|uniref:Uncharacterized protein n=1 Tax=Amycolatopsis cynarae TaxID=2995223 RepID=A0ABY7B746_9PSEU|nr:hypothetical protein [Amycolatopsis sp. HUAS 11-8]WAL67087.1 hypothetical protein ORV05_04685 [Amycolatopsis sp. HUAS 11-8]
MTPEERNSRALRARIGAHSRWARCDDRPAATAAARASSPASTDRWEREVDPEGRLSVHERAVRAAHAKSAYYARLSLAAKKARAARRKAA